MNKNYNCELKTQIKFLHLKTKLEYNPQNKIKNNQTNNYDLDWIAVYLTKDWSDVKWCFERFNVPHKKT